MKMAPHLEEALRLRLQLQGAEAADAQASLVSLTTNVEAQRPDVGSAVAPDGTVTLLFSDIEDSTAMNVELGDDAWRSLLDEHDALCRRAIAAHDGYEVKTVGDAFMVAFGSARAAVRCAREMQQAMTERNGDAEHSIRIRIGLHTGEPVQQADDFYGTDVVLASRLCSAGDGGDILVSPLLRDLVASSGEFELTAREPVALKGLDGEYVTYMVGVGVMDAPQVQYARTSDGVNIAYAEIGAGPALIYPTRPCRLSAATGAARNVTLASALS